MLSCRSFLARGAAAGGGPAPVAADGAIAATLEEIRRDADVSVGASIPPFLGQTSAGCCRLRPSHGRIPGGIRRDVAQARHRRGWHPRRRRPPLAVVGRQPQRRRHCCSVIGLNSAELSDAIGSSSPPCGTMVASAHSYGALRPMQAESRPPVVRSVPGIQPGTGFRRRTQMPALGGQDVADAAWIGIAGQDIGGGRVMRAAESFYTSMVPTAIPRGAMPDPRRASR